MTFWNWRRGSGGSATAGTAALANGTDLAPIELYTPDTRVVGWIASNGQRVTDLLLATEELRLWQPSGGGEGTLGRKVNDQERQGYPSRDGNPTDPYKYPKPRRQNPWFDLAAPEIGKAVAAVEQRQQGEPGA